MFLSQSKSFWITVLIIGTFAGYTGTLWIQWAWLIPSLLSDNNNFAASWHLHRWFSSQEIESFIDSSFDDASTPAEWFLLGMFVSKRAKTFFYLIYNWPFMAIAINVPRVISDCNKLKTFEVIRQSMSLIRRIHKYFELIDFLQHFDS